MNIVSYDMMVRNLLGWFHVVRESYFFRINRTPYRVWISEVTLQQTKIQSALAPLQRFLETFPSLESLAEAKEDDVLQAFRGLGYYSRAKNLYKGAGYIMKEFQGKLPQKYEDLLKIPSIGPYTAAAISSICFGARIPVVDGNVKRVLSRLFCWPDAQGTRALEDKSRHFLQKLFQELNFKPGDLNEAIMELGQKLCLRTRPNCSDCPLNDWCQAFQTEQISYFPVKKSKRKKIELSWTIYLVRNSNGDFLMQRWKDFYFLKNHMGFPSVLEFAITNKKLYSWKNRTKAPGCFGKIAYSLQGFRHGITHHSIEVIPYVIDYDTDQLRKRNFSWVKAEEVEEKLVASVLTKVWQSYKKNDRLLW